MKLAGTMRLPFVVLTPACVMLGITTALYVGSAPPWWEIVLVVLGAICAHIAVNVLNEYQDFKSGLDATTHRTPFSGGSGTLQKHPELASASLVLGIGITVSSIAIGAYFVISGEWLLVAIGGVGMLAVVLYTPWIARRPILCLIAPGVGFGPCMVLGAHIALGASLGWGPIFASMVPFFLVSNLLLLNQFPDVEPDRGTGRKNIIIAYGKKTGIIVYGLFNAFSYLAIGAGVTTGFLPPLSLIGLVTLPLAVLAFAGAARTMNDIEGMVPSLGINVLVVLATPVLAAIGILFG